VSVLFKALKRAAHHHQANRETDGAETAGGEAVYDPEAAQPDAAGAPGQLSPKPGGPGRLRLALRVLALVLLVLAGASAGLLYVADVERLRDVAVRLGVVAGEEMALQRMAEQADAPAAGAGDGAGAGGEPSAAGPEQAGGEPAAGEAGDGTAAGREARELAAARADDPVPDPPPAGGDAAPAKETPTTGKPADDGAPGAGPPTELTRAAPSPAEAAGGGDGPGAGGRALAGLLGLVKAGMENPPAPAKRPSAPDGGEASGDPDKLSSAGFPDPDAGQQETEAEVGTVLPGGGVTGRDDAGAGDGEQGDAGTAAGQKAAGADGEQRTAATGKGLGPPVEKAPPGAGETAGVKHGEAPRTGAVSTPRGRVAVKPGGRERARWLTRAHRALQAGEPEEALGFYEQILKGAPRDPRALFGRGVALQRMGMEDAARGAYRKVLDVAPDHGGALANLQTLIGRRKPAVALRRLSELAEKHPDVSTIPAQKAGLLADTGSLDQAVKAMKQAVSLAPRNLNHRLNLAILNDRAGNRAAALKHYRAALQLARSTGQTPDMPVEQVKARVEYLKKQVGR